MEAAQPVFFWFLAVLTAGCALATVVTQNIVRSATWLLFTLAGTSGVFFVLGADIVGAIQLLVYVGGTLVLVVFGVMLTAQGPFVKMKASGAEWAISATVGLLLLGVLVFSVSHVRIPDVRRLQVEGKKKLADKEAELKAAQARAKASKDKVDQDLESIKADRIGVAEMEASNKALIRDQAEVARKQAELDKLRLPPSVEYSPEFAQNPDPDKSSFSATIGEGFLGVGVGPAHREQGKLVRTNYLLPFELVSVHLLVVLIGAAYLARAKRRRV